MSLTVASSSSRGDTWSLLDGNFNNQQVDLQSVGEAGVVVRATDNATRTIAWEDVVRAEAVSPSRAMRAKFQAIGRDGDVLAGQPTGFADEKLSWQGVLMPRLEIALSSLRAIVRPGATLSSDQPPTQDTVRLNNGDVIAGFLSAADASSVTVTVDGEPVSVPWDSVLDVVFAATGSVKPSAENQVRLWLVDGTIVSARDISLKDDMWSLALPADVKGNVPRSSVIAIEHLNGPVSWLSGRAPDQIEQIPYLGQTWPTRMDRSTAGDPIRFGSRTYSRGIGVHSKSLLTWTVDDTFKALRLQYAIDGDLPFADVTVRVLLDGKPAHEAAHVRAGQLSPVVVVPLNGAKSLSLEVDMGDGFDVQDRLNWIEPALLRDLPENMPVSEP